MATAASLQEGALRKLTFGFRNRRVLGHGVLLAWIEICAGTWGRLPRLGHHGRRTMPAQCWQSFGATCKDPVLVAFWCQPGSFKNPLGIAV